MSAATRRCRSRSTVDDHGQDYTARIEARVIDASGREVAGHGATVATYGRFLVVPRTDRFVYSGGARAAVDVRAIDYDGVPQPGVHLGLRLERIVYGRDGGPPTYTLVEESSVEADAEGRATWNATVPGAPGSYQITASAPSEGRTVEWPGLRVRAGPVGWVHRGVRSVPRARGGQEAIPAGRRGAAHHSRRSRRGRDAHHEGEPDRLVQARHADARERSDRGARSKRATSATPTSASRF